MSKKNNEEKKQKEERQDDDFKTKVVKNLVRSHRTKKDKSPYFVRW